MAWARGDAVKSTAAISIGNKTTPAILLAPVAVIKDNIKQTVIKDGFSRIWKPLRSACRRKNGLSRFASAGA